MIIGLHTIVEVEEEITDYVEDLMGANTTGRELNVRSKMGAKHKALSLIVHMMSRIPSRERTAISLIPDAKNIGDILLSKNII